MPHSRSPGSSTGFLALLSGSLPRLALLLIFIVVSWNYIIFRGSDPYKCQALVGEGHWPSSSPLDHKWRRWEPTGCRMHSYTRDDFRDCLKNRRVVFVGDSTTRQLYWAAGRRLDHIKTEVALLDEYNSETPKQANIAIELEGVKLEFIWDPWLNSSDYHKTLSDFRETPTLSDVDAIKEAGKSPALLVLGAPGLWAARHGGSNYLDLFRSGIDTAKPHLKERVTLPPVGDRGFGFGDLPNRMMLVPVQTPWYDHLVSGRLETITPDKIVAMNDHLHQFSVAEQSHVLWAYEEMSSNIYEAFEDTGLHVVDGIADRRLDVLLSARCTAALAVRDRQYKYTCCMAYPSLAWGQLFFLLMAAGLGVSVFLKSRREAGAKIAKPGGAAAIATLALVSIYCYMTDRTHAFPKTSMDYGIKPFVVKASLFALASLASFRIEKGQTPGSKAPQPPKRGFMPRELSDEAKGIIQALLLIGHYHGLIQEDWAYKIMRFLVAIYIYLSAYGHATYFLSTDDFSFRRVVKVLTRLNVLAVAESFALSGDWTFYHFMPTISCWFLVIYATFAVGQKLNGEPMLLCLKVLVSALVFTSFIKIDLFLTSFVNLMNLALRTGWNSGTLRNHLAEDRFMPYLGMFTAIVAHTLSKPKRQSMQHQNWTGSSQKSRRSLTGPAVDILNNTIAHPTFRLLIKPVVILASAAGLIVYLIMMHTAIHNRGDYERLHPYISLGPVVGYAIVRNAFEVMRRSHFAVPRALGRTCLATYILHHHIWLAGNGSTILRFGLVEGGVLGGMARVAEEGILTLVFFWVSARATKATQGFVAWIVGEEAEEDTTSSQGSGNLLGPVNVNVPKVNLPDAEVPVRVAAVGALLWFGNLLY